jgi:hypothetical protein
MVTLILVFGAFGVLIYVICIVLYLFGVSIQLLLVIMGIVCHRVVVLRRAPDELRRLRLWLRGKGGLDRGSSSSRR